MATPMTATQWKNQMDKWGVNAHYLSGWGDRGRPASTAGGPFAPNGVMWHHTGSDSQASSYVNWLFKDGRPKEGIPAPLAQAMPMMDGRFILGARGKANHAGIGSRAILNKVVAGTIRVDKEENPGSSTVNGNPRFYGFECAFDGGQAMTAKMYETAILATCAILDFHGWNARSVIGHGEWTSAKWDPGKTDMAKVRRDVAARLKAGPKGAVAPVVPSKPTPIPETGKYTVVKGDTLSAIAKRFGTTVVTLTVWNKIKDPNQLEVGQVLHIRKPAEPPADPATKMIDWFEVASLNTWGDDGGEGSRTYNARLPHMVADVTKSKPEVLLLQEVRVGQRRATTKALKAKGYKHVKSVNRLATYVRNDVEVLHYKWTEYKTQKGGAKEGIVMVHIKVDGHEAVVGNTHLDYRAGFDQGRVNQAIEGFAELKRIATVWGVRHASTALGGDMNSVSWVTDKAAEKHGYADAYEKAKSRGSRKKDPIDYIYTKGRPVRYAGDVNTKSDHKIHRAVLQRQVTVALAA